VALSMEEQRILDEMERNLAADDPRLASRLSSFGQQRLPGTLKSQRVRTIAGLLALAMIAAVTVTMFMLSPYVNARHDDYAPKAHPTAGAPTATTQATKATGSTKSAGSTKSTGTTGNSGATIGAPKPAARGGSAGSARTGPSGTGSATTGATHTGAAR
jgi:hypothetical protein